MSSLMFSRRAALALSVGVVALGLAGTAASAAELRVLNWQGYGTDEKWALEMFEQKTGVKVTHDYFNSEQEMLTKLRTSPGTYDVVLMNNIYVPEAAKEGLIQAIDTAKISNFGDLSPSLRDSDRFVIDGKHMAISWVWGLTSFGYNSEKMKAPDSIATVWDDGALKGKVGWRDDALESVQLAALATGQDMNNPADLNKIKEQLMKLKGTLNTFWSSEDEWNKHLSAGDFDIAVYWSGSAARAKKAFKLPVEFWVPKEGAIGWYDGLTIAANAPNLEAAHAFINFMVDPEFYVKWDTDVGAPASANAKANNMLPEDAMNKTVLGNPDVVARVKWMAPITDEQRKAYQELWDEVKTAIAK
jgi:spermidine/putrescine transport system substrate-binding protein